MVSDSPLLELPNELLHHILFHVDPADLARVRLTCRYLKDYLKGDELLFKKHYLHKWDEPLEKKGPLPGPSIGETWESRLHHAVWLEKVLLSDSVDAKINDYQKVVEYIHALLQIPPEEDSLNIAFLQTQFPKPNRTALLCRSSLFHHLVENTVARTEFERQLSAKLHCLYGVPIDPRKTKTTRPTHPYARSKVYDLRNYDNNTIWGPFRPDGSGRVDWEKMEAIMVVLGYNMRVLTEEADMPFARVWRVPFDGAMPWSAPHKYEGKDWKLEMVDEVPLSLDQRDPYGVTGTWLRVVCFLDYHDFYAFNFAGPFPDPDEPRGPIDIREAIRFIKLTIQVTSIEAPGPDDGQDLPVVYFKGMSSLVHSFWDPNANSEIRGMVRMTREGEIRWTSFSIFQGEERWRSEGIQVGGLCSARGVMGTWFDKDYDPHGPAGPTAFWKTSNSVGEETSEDEDEEDEVLTFTVAY